MAEAEILAAIIAKRRQRLASEGPCFGQSVPRQRLGPLQTFVPRDGFVIGEIKRRSPSRGSLAEALDPVRQAQDYCRSGIDRISILTEEDHFQGSLADLMAVRAALPGAALLRKDFLLSEEEVEVSYSAGADCILLIAALLSKEELKSLHGRATELGLATLVEVHDAAEIARIRDFKPSLVGLNARDLHSFRIDALLPLALRDEIDWPTRLVYESGIFSSEDACFAGSSGFSAVLVGEALVKRPELGGGLVQGLRQGQQNQNNFWPSLAQTRQKKLLIKICGITETADGHLAQELGADLLGFVFAPSPRRASLSVLQALRDLAIPKVAVVVDEIPEDLRQGIDAGLVNALQFSGDEGGAFCAAQKLPWYKTLKVQNPAQLRTILEAHSYSCPRILLDAYSPKFAGGTGLRVNTDIVHSLGQDQALWLAGGLGPDNIEAIVQHFHPELIDASSLLEAEPGKKDKQKLKSYIAMARGAL